MNRRVLVLPLSAAVIAGLCFYKWTRPHSNLLATLPAPLCRAIDFKFVMRDQKRRPETVRLKGYLGRHRILIVFYDGDAGAENDAVLTRLRSNFDAVKRAGVIVLGISTALPQQNRATSESGRARIHPNQPRDPFPFLLLTDLPPACKTHRRWGRYDDKRNRTLTGTFLIDRSGHVACDGRIPRPLADPHRTIDKILAGQ